MQTDHWRLLGAVIVLGAIAALAPAPLHITDADLYEQMSREWFIPKCNELHCSRVLVPMLLGLIPGASIVKWKAFAVLCQAGAAWLTSRWVRRLGATPMAEHQVFWLTALGSGSLYTLFDPYTADPAMHLLTPVLLLLLFDAKIAQATAIAAVGVIAKEFAAVPLLVAALVWLQQRQWPEARRALIGFCCVVAVWGLWILWLRETWGFTYGKQQSANVLGGGFLLYWMGKLPLSVIVGSILMTLGALWVLWPAGLRWASRPVVQLTWAALPSLLVWCYVQQPDRALWNFAFAAMPAAAAILARANPFLGWSIVWAQVLGNLRVGAQFQFLPSARFAFVIAVGLALIAVWQVAAGPRSRLAAGVR